VVYLEGDLGAGKTTLSRGILGACGHSGAVKSPTYTLVEPYEFEAFTVYHFDLYRLGDPEELEYLGIRDYFGSKCLCLLEWPMRGEGYLPPADLKLSVKVQGEGRQVTIEGRSDLGQILMVEGASAWA
jgi:tRNA threonylcarbamoyladenosine biosynthesis protein TsaE